MVFIASLALAGCGKKDDSAGKAGGGAAASSGGGAKSGLAWTPENYDKMSEGCKKALACCEEHAKAGGAKSAEDFNGKCSGPALWKDDECAMDMKSRVTVLEAESKPVPAACK
jgi:hypothetical protein